MIRWIRLLAVLVIALTSALSASAQSATPVTGGPLLGKAGFPELALSGTDKGLTKAPTSITAGRYLVTLNNTAQDAAELDFVTASDTQSYDSLAKIYTSTANSQDFPKELYSVDIIGGVEAPAGSTGQAIMDFQPGEYLMGFGTQPDNGSGTPFPYDLKVTGSFPDVADPGATVDVKMYEMAFDMPDSISAGDAIWKLSNTGDDQPHFMDLISYPDPMTKDQVSATVAQEFGGGTPEADVLDFSKVQDVYSSALLAPGATNWVELNLPAGHYAALCFIPDKDTGQPHALMGMIAVFEVT